MSTDPKKQVVDAADLPKFSYQSFVDRGVALETELELIATVYHEDGDSFVIEPEKSPAGIVYRIPKAAVKIIEQVGPKVGSGEISKCKIALRRNAIAVAMRAGSVDALMQASAIVGRSSLLSTLRASISFTANGEGSLSFGGKTVPCLGNPTVQYTKDLTVQGIVGQDKFPRKYSNEYNVWMDFAVLIMGARGIYIHEGPATLGDNGGPSAGCIHLASPNAKEFYDWVNGPTRITISYPW